MVLVPGSKIKFEAYSAVSKIVIIFTSLTI